MIRAGIFDMVNLLWWVAVLVWLAVTPYSWKQAEDVDRSFRRYLEWRTSLPLLVVAIVLAVGLVLAWR